MCTPTEDALAQVLPAVSSYLAPRDLAPLLGVSKRIRLFLQDIIAGIKKNDLGLPIEGRKDLQEEIRNLRRTKELSLDMRPIRQLIDKKDFPAFAAAFYDQLHATLREQRGSQ